MTINTRELPAFLLPPTQTLAGLDELQRQLRGDLEQSVSEGDYERAARITGQRAVLPLVRLGLFVREAQIAEEQTRQRLQGIGSAVEAANQARETRRRDCIETGASHEKDGDWQRLQMACRSLAHWYELLAEQGRRAANEALQASALFAKALEGATVTFTADVSPLAGLEELWQRAVCDLAQYGVNLGDGWKG